MERTRHSSSLRLHDSIILTMENISLDIGSQTGIGVPPFDWCFPLLTEGGCLDGAKGPNNEASGAQNSETENQADSFSKIHAEIGLENAASQDPKSPSSLISIEDYNDLRDEDLRDLPVRELNKRLQGLPVCEVRRIRKRRRSLKNRGYALNCRLKRKNIEATMVQVKEGLNEELNRVKAELEKTRAERDMYKAKNEELRQILGTYCNGATLFSGRLTNQTVWNQNAI